MIEQFENLFMTSSFNDLYSYVRDKRTEYGMEVDTDKAFEETKSVITRFRKYVSQTATLCDNCKKAEEMFTIIAERLAQCDDVPATRQEMVFFAMRDEWLIGVYNVLATVINESEDDDE